MIAPRLLSLDVWGLDLGDGRVQRFYGKGAEERAAAFAARLKAGEPPGPRGKCSHGVPCDRDRLHAHSLRDVPSELLETVSLCERHAEEVRRPSPLARYVEARDVEAAEALLRRVTAGEQAVLDAKRDGRILARLETHGQVTSAGGRFLVTPRGASENAAILAPPSELARPGPRMAQDAPAPPGGPPGGPDGPRPAGGRRRKLASPPGGGLP